MEPDKVKVEDDKYNIYNTIHVYFYSKNDNGEIEFLLNRNAYSQQNTFEAMSSELSYLDNVPTFGVGRMMLTKYWSLFSKANIEKIKNKKQLDEKDLLKNCKWFQIWEKTQFWDWLDIMSQNPIQIDSIEGRIVYFLQIDFIDTGFLNENLKKLDYGYEFKYFHSSKIISENLSVNLFSFDLFKSINIEEHINTTILNHEESASVYIVMSCNPNQYSKKDQNGSFHFPSLFQGLYKKNNEKWLYYAPSVDGIPEDTILKKCKAVIIPGSYLSVYQEHDHLQLIKEFIKNCYANYPQIKFLGICFGAQLIAEVEGVPVISIPGSFIWGLENIKIKEDFWNLSYVKKAEAEKAEYLNIWQAHGDEITSTPNKYTHMGYSESCKQEVIVSENNKALLIQGHPEYDPFFLLCRSIDKHLYRHGFAKNEKNCESLREQMYKSNVDKMEDIKIWRKICFYFLKSS